MHAPCRLSDDRHLDFPYRYLSGSPGVKIRFKRPISCSKPLTRYLKSQKLETSLYCVLCRQISYLPAQGSVSEDSWTHDWDYSPHRLRMRMRALESRMQAVLVTLQLSIYILSGVLVSIWSGSFYSLAVQDLRCNSPIGSTLSGIFLSSKRRWRSCEILLPG